MPEATDSLNIAPGPEEPFTLDINLESQQKIAELLSEYGDIIKLNDTKRGDLSFLITNPDAIKQILISNHGNYTKGVGFERVKMLLGNGIIVSDGDFWRRQRTLIQPAFSKKNILKLYTTMKTVTQTLIPRWAAFAESGEPVDITTEVSIFSLEVILRALISDDLDKIIAQQGVNPFSFLADDPTRDLSVAMKFRQLCKLVQTIIDTRRKNNEHPGDLLDSLMLAADKDGNKMSNKELIDEIMTMIIAGHETTGGTLNWIWHKLSQHPKYEQKVHQEAAAVVTNNSFSDDGLNNLSFTKQVIDEALRLYPPVWLFSRKTINDDAIAGYAIPAGSNIFLSPYYTQRDVRLWEKANEFYPEHFRNNGNELSHKYAFIPFSAGSRRCIGEYFSYIEMQTHIAILINLFKLKTLPDQQIEIEPAINLRTKNSIMMQISLR